MQNDLARIIQIGFEPIVPSSKAAKAMKLRKVKKPTIVQAKIKVKKLKFL